jgi:hypothetical protein
MRAHIRSKMQRSNVHVNQHRQHLYLISVQVSSYVYFLAVCPVLRYGPNNHRFPFASPEDSTAESIGYIDSRLDTELQFLSTRRFKAAMSFACTRFPTVLAVFALTPLLTRNRHVSYWEVTMVMNHRG